MKWELIWPWKTQFKIKSFDVLIWAMVWMINQQFKIWSIWWLKRIYQTMKPIEVMRFVHPDEFSGNSTKIQCKWIFFQITEYQIQQIEQNIEGEIQKDSISLPDITIYSFDTISEASAVDVRFMKISKFLRNACDL